MEKIGVIGFGQMGQGIAQVSATAGYSVKVYDAQDPQRGLKKIEIQLGKLVEKNKLDRAGVDRILKSITLVQKVEDLSDSDLCIEAIVENLAAKTELFKKLDSACKPATILATNTSSISITAIAAATARPEKVVGMHFMNPVPVMKLIEGIRGLQTSDDTFRVVRLVSEKMGKIFIESKDVPGFAVNRILMPMINEAITALYEGVASASDIDQAMKLGTNQPMGPLELADFIGLDTCLSIMNVLHEGLGDTKYRASPLLKKHVAAGWLGRKTKRGFFKYDV